MKWRLHYFICILMVPVLLLTYVKIHKTPHAIEIKQLFMKHQEEFHEVVYDLLEIAYKNDSESGTWIITEGSARGSFVDQIGSLKYYGTGPIYPREEYENIHSTVVDLFSSLHLCAIGFDRWSVQIVISESYFGNCRLIYFPYDLPFDANFQIKEKIHIFEGWYAVVTDD